MNIFDLLLLRHLLKDDEDVKNNANSLRKNLPFYILLSFIGAIIFIAFIFAFAFVILPYFVN